MSETLIILAMAVGFGFYTDFNHPKQYALNLENGITEQVIIQQKGKYACPRYCATDHYHIARMCERGCTHDHTDYRLHRTNNSKEQMVFNGQIVLAMERVSYAKDKMRKKINQAHQSK